MLVTATALIILVALFHSIAGEIRLIRPLLARRDLPKLGPGPWYVRALIRTAWHITSLTWLGLAAVLTLLPKRPDTANSPAFWAISLTFALSGLAALILSRGRHPAWLAFLPVAGLTGAVAAGF